MVPLPRIEQVEPVEAVCGYTPENCTDQELFKSMVEMVCLKFVNTEMKKKTFTKYNLTTIFSSNFKLHVSVFVNSNKIILSLGGLYCRFLILCNY